MKYSLTCSLLLALMPLLAFAGPIFSWVDSDGVTHFSESPPEDGSLRVRQIEVEPVPVVGDTGGDDYYSVVRQAERMQKQRLENQRAQSEQLQAEAAARQAEAAAAKAQEPESRNEPAPAITYPVPVPVPVPFTHPGGTATMPFAIMSAIRATGTTGEARPPTPVIQNTSRSLNTIAPGGQGTGSANRPYRASHAITFVDLMI